MIRKSDAFEIERVKWLQANGHPNYALYRAVRLLIRQRKEWVFVKYNRMIINASLYHHHIWPEFSVRKQLTIIREYLSGDK